MAPPLQPFPLSELQSKIQYKTENLKTKRRKSTDWDLETCELLELVQYSCKSFKEKLDERLQAQEGGKKHAGDRTECWPFVRLFRRCGTGEKMFHVETTAWEGEHAYEAPSTPRTTLTSEDQKTSNGRFASYGSHFWSIK